MTLYSFNRNPVLIAPKSVDDATDDQIEATPQLRRAPLNKAVLFGGPLVRRALQSCPLVGDREYVLADTKVTMLRPGWNPSVPGWHTEAVPRGNSGNPADPGPPSLRAQAEQTAAGYFPRFHTLIVGVPCLSQFVVEPLDLDLDHAEDPGLYTEMTEHIEALRESKLDVVCPDVGRWATWDWWNIHAPTASSSSGWRLLIRVVETDTAPLPGDFIAAQSQVYVPLDTGW